MLIRSIKNNTLANFGEGCIIKLYNGYIACIGNGGYAELIRAGDFNKSKKLIDEIQKAYLDGEKIYVIEESE